MTNTTNDIELRPLSHVELIAHLTKRCESLTAERDTLKAQAARYEYVRTLNPRSFQELWTRCMNEAIQFDKAVDEGIAHREITRARSILK